MSRKCSVTRADGNSCQAWAMRDSQPPLCYFHLGRHSQEQESDDKSHNKDFYRRTYTLEEIADLVHLALDHSLDDEVAAVRVAVRRVMQQLHEELTPTEYARLASAIFTGANTIARLVRTSRDLADDTRDMIRMVIEQVLDEQSNDK